LVRTAIILVPLTVRRVSCSATEDYIVIILSFNFKRLFVTMIIAVLLVNSAVLSRLFIK